MVIGRKVCAVSRRMVVETERECCVSSGSGAEFERRKEKVERRATKGTMCFGDSSWGLFETHLQSHVFAEEIDS